MTIDARPTTDLSRRALLGLPAGSHRDTDHHPGHDASPVRRRAVIANNCLVNSGIDCRQCVEDCPQQAISFSITLGGLQLRLDDPRCDGCGECRPRCPTQAISLHQSPGQS
ncbi:MAG: 4Fe-4S binding protein [Gammaproteobacteria bacterium]|nr:4Fe-4S binding protein [Gammaproteobacteria bacterium]